VKAAVTPHRQKRKAAKAVSAWAAAQTLPRQKRSWLRKTPRAMNPAKKKRALLASNAMAAQGWDAGADVSLWSA
jgi:hypothetical protein